MRVVRIVNLDDYDHTCRDDAITVLQMLVEMHNETHRLWKLTPSDGGAWNYEKA